MRLKELLKGKLTAQELSLLVQGYDLVGDMAITIIPDELSNRQELIAEAIMAVNKRVKVVAKRVGTHGGEHRTITLAVIAGERRKETLHVEFGVRLLLNPELVYFSVRSGSERKRVADLVQPKERVLVMFSGVAPYPLMIEKYSRAESIVGVELNPRAHEYGLRNRTLNKMEERVELICGDVAEVLPRLGCDFHRIVMPLPTGAVDFLPLALESLRSGGTLHIYNFQPTGEYDASLESVRMLCSLAGRTVLRSVPIVCGHTSPGVDRICLDTVVD